MDTNKNKLEDPRLNGEKWNYRVHDERIMVIGLVALVIIAFLALGIRYLLPGLNPLIIVALGVTTYGVYLSSLLLAALAQAKQQEASAEPVEMNTWENESSNNEV